MITVEVVYARPERQKIVSLQVEADCTLKMAIELSNIKAYFPEIDLSVQKVGIFSEMMPLTKKLKDGDRVEIYRPLIIDPMAARRNRAAEQASKV